MPVGRSQFAAYLKPDLWRVFIETGKRRPVEYDKFFNVKDMPWNPVDDRQAAGLPTLESMNEGETFPLEEPLDGGTVQYEAEIFGLGVEITFPMWVDDQYGIIRTLVRELTNSSINKQEVEAWSVLNNAFDTNFAGFDGTSLCSTSHTQLDPAVSAVANRPATDVTLSALAIQNSQLRFENMQDERGLPRLFQPTTLVIAPENKFLAREILGSAGKPLSADNEINSLVEEDLRVMVCHYFTNTNQWFLTASQGEHDLNFLWRNRPIFDVFDDPWSKNAVATVWQRHTKGFGSYRGVDGSRVT